MPDLGDIPVLSRGAIPGGGVAGVGVTADARGSSGLVWLEDGVERPFLEADAPRPWLEASDEDSGAPMEHLHPHQDVDPPTLLWV